MTTAQIVILIVVIVVVAAIVALAVASARRRALRQRFGPEYERVVAEQPSRSAAEHELRERERRHAELDLRPLPAPARAEYAAAWQDVQTRFVDSPRDAVRAGDELVTRLLREIGYPTEDYDERFATLSVEHAQTLGHYRDAHDVFQRNERGEASTEQLRQALMHYRALFDELLGDETAPRTQPAPTEMTEPTQRTEPTDLTEPTRRTEPTQRTEPAQRTEPTRQTEPTRRTDGPRSGATAR
ncbi:hypothetical protein GCM10023322_39430 [Rugosimonospora acidiphila]|uniref:Secreted protein n=1 Tax=Rugosimonospora acidiphila TaxID=556531 RepID=A0ABP9RXJ0_9ACTN